MSAIASQTDVAAYALRLGDDALILSQRLAAWCSRAPDLEEDVALANIALDLLGQARMLLTYAGSLDGSAHTEDDLAYTRSEREFTNLRIVEFENGDFAQTIARQLLFSSYQLELYKHLSASVDDTLSAVAAKAVKEVSYHADHAAQWTLRLGDGTAESHRRMQSGLEAVWPFVHEMFEPDELTARLFDAGVGADPPSLRPAWEARVGETISAGKLEPPTTEWQPSGGRRGVHGEAFGFLIAELQYLHRSYPGASW